MGDSTTHKGGRRPSRCVFRKDNTEQIRLLKQEMEKGPVTLVYGAKDEEHNEARVLQENSALFH